MNNPYAALSEAEVQQAIEAALQEPNATGYDRIKDLLELVEDPDDAFELQEHLLALSSEADHSSNLSAVVHAAADQGRDEFDKYFAEYAAEVSFGTAFHEFPTALVEKSGVKLVPHNPEDFEAFVEYAAELDSPTWINAATQLFNNAPALPELAPPLARTHMLLVSNTDPNVGAKAALAADNEDLVFQWLGEEGSSLSLDVHAEIAHKHGLELVNRGIENMLAHEVQPAVIETALSSYEGLSPNGKRVVLGKFINWSSEYAPFTSEIFKLGTDVIAENPDKGWSETVFDLLVKFEPGSVGRFIVEQGHTGNIPDLVERVGPNRSALRGIQATLTDGDQHYQLASSVFNLDGNFDDLATEEYILALKLGVSNPKKLQREIKANAKKVGETGQLAIAHAFYDADSLESAFGVLSASARVGFATSLADSGVSSVDEEMLLFEEVIAENVSGDREDELVHALANVVVQDPAATTEQKQQVALDLFDYAGDRRGHSARVGSPAEASLHHSYFIQGLDIGRTVLGEGTPAFQETMLEVSRDHDHFSKIRETVSMLGVDSIETLRRVYNIFDGQPSTQHWMIDSFIGDRVEEIEQAAATRNHAARRDAYREAVDALCFEGNFDLAIEFAQANAFSFSSVELRREYEEEKQTFYAGTIIVGGKVRPAYRTFNTLKSGDPEVRRKEHDVDYTGRVGTQAVQQGKRTGDLELQIQGYLWQNDAEKAQRVFTGQTVSRIRNADDTYAAVEEALKHAQEFGFDPANTPIIASTIQEQMEAAGQDRDYSTALRWAELGGLRERVEAYNTLLTQK